MPETQELFLAVVDVTAANAFTYGFQLALQNHMVPIVATPSGLHAEVNVLIDGAPNPQDRKLLLYFDGEGQNGLGITFKITLTPINDGGIPQGPAIAWSLTWVTSPLKPARLKGFLPLSAFKPDVPKADPQDADAGKAKGK